MIDTDFFVPADKAPSLRGLLLADANGADHGSARWLTLQDDPTTSSLPVAAVVHFRRRRAVLDRRRLLTFCRVLLNGGELGRRRLISARRRWR